jgi:hypothetical protein
MSAVDDVDRLKREGFLTYFRLPGYSCAPDETVVEAVAITLRTPTDPRDRCVEEVVVEFLASPYEEDRLLYPRLHVEQGALKMLALFPGVLIPFSKMNHWALSPDEFVAGLRRIGIHESGHTTS